jgi:XTP/dITP diphosphohydrolase
MRSALDMRLVIASRNVKKTDEMRVILESLLDPRYSLSGLDEFPDFEEPEESGATYAQNAAIKAEFSCSRLGAWCIADDAGLEIDALDGQPGVHSKRFGGVGTPFDQKIRTILSQMQNVDGDGRTARFRCAVAIARPGFPTQIFSSVREGHIAREPRGRNGFGYDPIFLIPELGKTMAELEPEEKNRISHRGMVLAEAAAWLNAL